ncbi:tyrosine-type recombinase/integrase [Spirosoma rhododendri]|uniref:Site-specific integrase n=1 Tax=Spirosoma rhododendri TaxID=2728024 RepID=A0A7L5DQS9_9BACT|nr:site-specific integrase [Spirosoma rhododendri]QJD79583.1 site-specific integrase [Spirosoma rhododendri]
MNTDLEPGNYPYKLPYLSRPADENLTGQWCVTYSVFSFDKNKLVRKRVIVTGYSVAERHRVATDIIAELTNYLKGGKAYVGTKPKQTARPRPEPPVLNLNDAGSIPIEKAVPEYLAYCKKVHARNTFKSYRTAVMDLLAYLERHHRPQATLAQFSSAGAIEFLHELITVVGVNNRSRNNRKGYIGTFFNHWIGLDRSKKLGKAGNPFEDKSIKKLPQVSNKHQAYSERQQAEYRQVCEDLGLDYLLTFNRWLYYTLMRPHEELRLLRVRDVRTHMIYVTGESAKTNDGGFVNIPLPLEELIQQQRIREYPGHYYVFTTSGEPGPVCVGPKFFYRRHQQVIEKLGMVGSGHDMYSWKHTGAIALWNATKDIELIRQQARHTDIKQTIEYLRDLGVRMVNDDKIHRFPRF